MMASEMATNTSSWLTLAIFVPIVFGIAVLILGRDDRAGFTRGLSLIGALVSLAVTLPLYAGFNPNTASMQFVEKANWIPAFNVQYYLGIDGISLWFVLLSAFVTVLIIIAGWTTIRVRVAQYMAAFLILSGLMIGVFAALDGMLFYVFFEASLIPIYLIIGGWGGEKRVYAAIKFFLYTLLGSLLTLVAFVYLWHAAGNTFDILAWQQLKLGMTPQVLVFLALLATIAVKIPMWPVHTWLPDAYGEAPIGGAVALSAVMAKMGAYAFLRLSLPIAPDAAHSLSGLMITLSLVAVIYVGLVALVQKDMKRLVAYASVAHMGLVTLGFFVFNAAGVEGGLVQMISHGFVSTAMFLCVGVLVDRMGSSDIADYGGVVNRMPRFATLMVLFAMANCGLPGTSGFVGEFFVILAAVQHDFWVGLLTASTVVIGAAYSLWLVKRVVFGPVANDRVGALSDISGREFLVLGVLALAVLYLGIYPKPFTDVMHVSVQSLLQHVAASKL